MRRLVVALVAGLAIVVVAVGTAVAVGQFGGPDDRPGYGRHHMAGPMMGWDAPGRARGWQGMGPGSGHRGWMHHRAAVGEFGYLAEMIAHHREAVAAATQLRRSDRSEMRAFGAAIVRTQSAQVDQMQRWLADWYPGRPTDVDYQPMMRDLSGLSGDRLDRAFLEDMIGHHMAAVMMSQQLLMRDGAEHPQVVRLAEEIRDGQHAEIFRMQRWLAQWYDESWWPLHRR